MKRQDQIDRFVVIGTGETCVWGESRSGLWHATVDGLHAVCSSTVVVELDLNDSGWSPFDRSNDTMTCENCADRVRRVRSGLPRPVDVEDALTRHLAREMDISFQDAKRMRERRQRHETGTSSRHRDDRSSR